MIVTNKQRGEVSLFVVIFSMLLITVITVSFVNLMIKNQQQASNADLSQSAYDSAQAGVEDAKRAILRYQSICGSGGDCNAARLAIDSGSSNLSCTAAVSALNGVTVSNSEVKIQTGVGGSNAAQLDQAYTCVKINLNTVDYLGVLAADSSVLVPLNSVGPFSTIKIQWFTSADLGANTSVSLLSLGTPLLAQDSWPTNRPPVMRTQLIQFGSNFKLTDLDDVNNNDTLFLYPSTIDSISPSFTIDSHKSPTNSAYPTKCLDDISGGGYSCS
jgi:Tfp pilus assembly protein PilX